MNTEQVFELFEHSLKERNMYDARLRENSLYSQGFEKNYNVTSAELNQSFGQGVNESIFSTEAIKAAFESASVLQSEIWPEGAKSFKYVPSRNIPKTPAVLKYFEEINSIKDQVLDSPEVGLDVAIEPLFLDLVTLGNAGLTVYRDEETFISSGFWGVQNCSFLENSKGYVDTVFYVTMRTVKQLVGEYGESAVSKETRELFKNNRLNDNVKVLKCIYPRHISEQGEGNKGMPFASKHFEYGTRHLLKESGFLELPIKFGRMIKKGYEQMGWGFTDQALPEIKELNFIAKALLKGTQKTVEPPLIVENDSVLGNVIETGPEGVNVVDMDARSDRDPIRPMFLIGDMRFSVEYHDRLIRSIREHFLLNTALDADSRQNTSRTFGELQFRENIWARKRVSVYSRIIKEIFNPYLTSVTNILFDWGLFGVVNKNSEKAIYLEQRGFTPIQLPPEIEKAIIDNRSFYDIVHMTPAAQVLRQSTVNSIFEVTQFASGVIQINPELSPIFKFDRALRTVAEIKNIEHVVASEDEAQAIYAQQAEMQQQQMQAQMLQAAAPIVKNKGGQA